MTPDPPKPATADDADAPPRRLRVFVVEDHQDSRDMLCMLLQMLGHDVVAARSMAQALADIPNAGCDVLLTDIGLPDGSGWELMRQLDRSTPPYALAMSGYGLNADIERSRAAGFRHHLVKPMGPELLKEFLAEAASEATIDRR